MTTLDVMRGVRVIELTMWAFVPAAGGVLAHWGADVIKVENPKAPDPMRLLGGTLEPGRASDQFKHYSRGKRSIALDLSRDEGREILYRLVEDADVFLTSYLPGTRRKLEVDLADIRRRNPQIIYARGSGQGPLGPDADRGGYDFASWWFRGSLGYSAMESTGAGTPPMMVGHGDGMAGMTLAGGIAAALFKRARTGETSVVDGSLLSTAVWFNNLEVMASRRTGPRPAPPRSVTNGIYQTKDGRFILLLMLGDADLDWVDLCEHIGRPDLARDPRFADAAGRVANRDAGAAEVAAAFAERTFEEWKKILVTLRGVWAPHQSPGELFDDAQVQANGFLREVEYPTGSLAMAVPAIQFDEEAGDPPRAPDFAADTNDVLAEMGASADEIARLRATGVVA
jgi:crotonobetainyl-CoA:carnitine CoA-transferase CaiB-like acyl-CoA transferase